MKRALLTCVIALIAFPLFAQYDGFYRIKNKGAAGRYISIQNNKVSNDSKNINWTSGYSVKTEVDALQLVRDKDSDPGTILYITGTNNGLTLEAQGLNTQKLISSLGQGDLNLLKGSNGELYTSYSGHPIYMLDFGFDYPTTYNGRVCCGVATSSWINKELTSEEKTYIRWAFKKIDNTNEYFGIKPTEGIQIGEKYYTTLFTTFAYQLPEDMKAFYIGRYDFNRQEPIAELKEITDRKIPASTPVIIECTSNDAANNKVTLLSDNLDPITGNQLNGNVFCFIPEGNEGAELWNVLDFNQNAMRLLGKLANGKLGFVANNDKALKVKSGAKYIPANKAYLPINPAYNTKTANGIELLLPEEYEVVIAGISNVTIDEKDNTNAGIYTLTGIKVKEDNNTDDLPSGIYIIDGKKQVIK